MPSQFAQRDEWTLLCDTLASRLVAAGDTLAATLCYICAGNIDKTVEIWSKNVTAENKGESYVDLLQVKEACGFDTFLNRSFSFTIVCHLKSNS